MASYVVSSLRKGNNFKKALQEATIESVKSAKGSRGVPVNYTGWKTFKKGNKEEDAIALNNAVKGCKGGWCTGGAVSTARSHLSGGDFHVWFKNGEPMLAIRTRNGKLASWPKTVKASDGKTVFMRNPEKGSLGDRIEHMISKNMNNKRLPDDQKFKWFPNVLTTIQNAVIRLRDDTPSMNGTVKVDDNKNRLYISKYADETFHAVVVDPWNRIVDHKEVDAGIITQFALTEHNNKQRGMFVEWIDSKKMKEVEAPQAPSFNSDKTSASLKSQNGSESLDSKVLGESTSADNIAENEQIVNSVVSALNRAGVDVVTDEKAFERKGGKTLKNAKGIVYGLL